MHLIFIKPGNDLLFRALRQSTIGAKGLNCRVRNGIGCYSFAIITRHGFVHKYYSFVNILNILTSPPNLTKVDNLKYNAINKNFIAGWSSLVARQAHNLKVLGSNPSPATN
jgi:hypothetical protein